MVIEVERSFDQVYEFVLKAVILGVKSAVKIADRARVEGIILNNAEAVKASVLKVISRESFSDKQALNVRIGVVLMEEVKILFEREHSGGHRAHGRLHRKVRTGYDASHGAGKRGGNS